METELVGTGFRRPNEWMGLDVLIFDSPELAKNFGELEKGKAEFW